MDFSLFFTPSFWFITLGLVTFSFFAAEFITDGALSEMLAGHNNPMKKVYANKVYNTGSGIFPIRRVRVLGRGVLKTENGPLTYHRCELYTNGRKKMAVVDDLPDLGFDIHLILKGYTGIVTPHINKLTSVKELKRLQDRIDAVETERNGYATTFNQAVKEGGVLWGGVKKELGGGIPLIAKPMRDGNNSSSFSIDQTGGDTGGGSP